MSSLCICIPFWFTDENLDRYLILHYLLNQYYKTYTCRFHIHIDTNDERVILLIQNHFQKHIEHGELSIEVHKELEHGFLLTWMHRFFITKHVDKFDYFMYVEDDIEIPFPHFLRYIENMHLLWSDHIPCFVRLEKKEDKYYHIDTSQTAVILEKDIIVRGGRRFARIKSDYQACWIFHRNQIIENATEENWFYPTYHHPRIQQELDDTHWDPWGIREIAASYGIYGLGRHGLVELESDTSVSPMSHIYHLALNYTKDRPVEEIEFNTLDTIVRVIVGGEGLNKEDTSQKES